VIPISDRNPTTRKPIVTLVLIALCAVTYFFVQPSPFASNNADAVFDVRYAAIPFEVTNRRPLDTCQLAAAGVANGNPVKPCRSVRGNEPLYPNKHIFVAVLTSIFLHGSIMHLLFNVLFLWIFGNNIEDRLGPLKYALFYVAGGIAATIAHIAASPNSISPVVGASGAIAAVMGAYLIWYPKTRINTLVLFIVLPIPAWLMLGVWFVTQFFTNPNSGVAWVAHVGGFLFGIAVAFVLRKQNSGLETPGAINWPPPST
jgi:membrane associated rhomboid family serine protease